MNYNSYIPYYIPSIPRQHSGLSTLFRNKLNIGSILTNTNKALNVVNQIVPIIKQATPVFKNAKTMFRVMNEFKKVNTPTKQTTLDSPQNNSSQISKEKEKTTIKTLNEEGPTFFM